MTVMREPHSETVSPVATSTESSMSLPWKSAGLVAPRFSATTPPERGTILRCLRETALEWKTMSDDGSRPMTTPEAGMGTHTSSVGVRIHRAGAS